jgi:dihydrofolate reductase
MEKKIGLIVATDKNHVIGVNGKLPWRSREELQHFVKLTKNATLIMGHSTYVSLPGPLVGRHIIILTRDSSNIELTAPHSDVTWCVSIQSAIDTATRLKPNDNIYIAGGASVYEEALRNDWVDYIDHSIMRQDAEYMDDDVVTKFAGFDIGMFREVKTEERGEFTYAKYIRGGDE